MRRRGRRVNARYLTLIYARREPPDPVNGAGAPTAALPTRVGFSVNKRVGVAVRRNQVKRRLREVFRRVLWKTSSGWDMIVIARPEAANAAYAELAADVEESLMRARLLR